MKFRRTLSSLLLGLGCAITFIGLLALVLPAMANDQMRLVLASFSLPAANWLVALINGGMSFALKNAWQVALTGAALAALGTILFCAFTPDAKREPAQPVPTPHNAAPEKAHSAPTRPNPYASFASWERYAPAKQANAPEAKPAFAPLLTPNAIEPSPAGQADKAEQAPPRRRRRDLPYQPPRTPAPAQAETIKAGAAAEASAAPAQEAAETMHMTFGRSMSPSAPPASPPAEKAERPETVFTPNEEPEMLSPRIRSTMGKRHSRT